MEFLFPKPLDIVISALCRGYSLPALCKDKKTRRVGYALHNFYPDRAFHMRLLTATLPVLYPSSFLGFLKGLVTP